MMTSRARFALPYLAAGLLAAACSNLGGTGGQYWLKAEGLRLPGQVESLQQYHAYVWNLGAAEWRKESDQLRDAASRERSLFLRLRQAIVAAAPPAPARERLRAMQLFEQCEQDARNDAALKSLIVLLRNELGERLRLEERARDEARRADELGQKLDALKAIELNLIERNRPGSGKKP